MMQLAAHSHTGTLAAALAGTVMAQDPSDSMSLAELLRQLSEDPDKPSGPKLPTKRGLARARAAWREASQASKHADVPMEDVIKKYCRYIQICDEEGLHEEKVSANTPEQPPELPRPKHHKKTEQPPEPPRPKDPAKTEVLMITVQKKPIELPWWLDHSDGPWGNQSASTATASSSATSSSSHRAYSATPSLSSRSGNTEKGKSSLSSAKYRDWMLSEEMG